MTVQETTNIHDASTALSQGLLHVCDQLEQVLDCLSDSDYKTVQDDKSSIGAHVRHVIEFMQAILQNTNIINYDARKRNLDIETSIEVARTELVSVIEALQSKLDSEGADASIYMIEQLSNGGPSVPVPSTLGREIAYAIQHGIHHIFIIKTQAEIYGISFDKKIGVAPATVTYQNQ
ncbi:MAG: DinB family protein [Bdellovibrionales bacterium]